MDPESLMIYVYFNTNNVSQAKCTCNMCLYSETILSITAVSGNTVIEEVATITGLNSEETLSLKFLEPVSLLWPEGIPSDGTPIVVENYPPLWLIVVSYTFSAAVIFGAVVSMVFTFVFRKRK